MRVSREMVIQVASDIANKDGLNKVSLKVIAENLGIRTPSLYNHIESLDDLLLEVAHKGMREMNNQMTKAVIGSLGDTAIKYISITYFNFIISNPGVYETIQWATWHGNNETLEIFNEYKSLLEKLILSCNLKIKNTGEVLNLIMSVFHGYSTLQLGKSLLNKEEAIKGLTDSIDTVLLGIHKKYD